MTTPDPRTAALLAAYRDELLRWNRQINLLSRRDAAATADHLIEQCAAAFDMWWEASGAGLASGGRLRWFDLGSGGGLPALVWLALLAGRGVRPDATLVEPRAKRAWFLERLAKLPGAPAFRVVEARWGDGVGFLAPPPGSGDDDAAPAGTPILFTLKALRLPEAMVLGGLGEALAPGSLAPGTEIEIVRFQPAVGVTAAGLARELGVPAAGQAHVSEELHFEAGAPRYLAPSGASRAAGPAGLFVTRHRLTGEDLAE